MIHSFRSLAAGVALTLALAAPAAAQDPQGPRSVATSHVAQLEDGPVAYQAVVAETVVRSEDGEGSGTVVTTSYIRTDAVSAERPVLFIFNGGPGASTTPLHFGAFGPMRRFGEADDQYLAMNPHSLLDAADLVFIDPVGTGYSRPHDDGAPFWSRTGDARSVADVIRDWLARHDRSDAPRYLLGQSYGTIRAAEITRVAPDLNFDGVLLFALVPGERSGLLAHMSALPSYAAAAWHHGRAARDGRTVEQVYEDAVVFARTDYIAALIQGAALPDAERNAMAGRLSAMTGLPAA
ncbi:MAG: S10 family serine carboxypeptidase-like protein, partial [Brevundimonas sp.]